MKIYSFSNYIIGHILTGVPQCIIVTIVISTLLIHLSGVYGQAQKPIKNQCGMDLVCD